MKRIVTFLMFICFFCINSTGQNSDCVKIEVVDTVISNPGDKKPNEAHISIEICYKKDKNINITLKRPYFITNGEKLTDQKAKRQGHQLFLKGISHYRIDLYEVKLNPDVPYEITDSLSLNFDSAKNSYWVNDSIEFTFKFLYKKAGLKKGDIEKDVKIRFKLPDNPNPADLLKKEKIDTIPVPQVVDTFTISTKREQLKTGKSSESEPEDNAGMIFECIDSVKFYYQKLFELYADIESNNALTNDNKKSLVKQFLFYNTRFIEFIESCDYPGKYEYKRNYDAIDSYLRKALEVGSETNEINLMNNDVIETKIERTFDIKDILFYVLSGFFVILAIAYVYSKIKRKRK